MDEYQLSDIIASNTSNMYMDSAGFFTLFSAYIVMTYLIGDKLTRFQVSFINTVFLGLALAGMNSMLVLINKNLNFLQQLHELDPQVYATPSQGEMGAYVFLTFRTLVVIGCLIFMWQVRHGNTIDKRT